MPPPELSELALDLAQRRPVFDAHVDSIQKALDLGVDLGVEGPGHLDLARGRRGGLGAVVLVNWVDPIWIDHPGCDAFERTRRLLRESHRLAERHPDLLRLVGNGRELSRVKAVGLSAGIAGIEGGHSIQEDLGKLRWFFDRGVRVMTLVWNNHLPWIRSCQDGAGPDVPAGLSTFGREVVAEMNRLGVVVDLSHAGEQSFFDALEASSRAPIASHSGCAALHAHPRNLNDDQLRALGEAGGVVGIAFLPAFLDEGARADDGRVRKTAAYRALAARAAADPYDAALGAEMFLEQGRLLQKEAVPLGAERVVDHIVHAVEVAGIEHVGLGSDFDGIERAPAGLEDASCYAHLFDLLLQRGFSSEEVLGLAGGNMERVFGDATGPGTLAHEAEIVELLD